MDLETSIEMFEMHGRDPHSVILERIGNDGAILDDYGLGYMVQGLYGLVSPWSYPEINRREQDSFMCNLKYSDLQFDYYKTEILPVKICAGIDWSLYRDIPEDSPH